MEEIINVPGIDGTIIGPYDLSGSMGMPGEFEKPVVKEALARYIDICKAHHFPMGFHVGNADSAKIQEKIEEGYRFIAYGTDFLFMGDTAAKGMKELRK